MRPAVHVFWGLAVMLGVLIRPGTAAGAGGSLCPGVFDQAGPPRCYPAAQAKAAQRAMARTAVPVWPGTVVWNLARLHLTQLQVRLPRQPLEISYLFGKLGTAEHPVVDDDLGRHKPLYVLVGELHSPVAGRLGSAMRNTTGAGGSYWTFYANFRCRPLSLSVTTNERRWMAGAIGRHILGAEVCGQIGGCDLL